MLASLLPKPTQFGEEPTFSLTSLSQKATQMKRLKILFFFPLLLPALSDAQLINTVAGWM